MPSTRASLLAQGGEPDEALREAVILATLMAHPRLIARFESALDRCEFTGPGHARLRDLLLIHAAAPDPHALRLLRPADATAPAWTQCGPLRPGLRDTVRLGRERLRCYAHVAGRRTPPPGV